MLSIKFLEAKRNLKTNMGWSAGEITPYAGRGNITQMNKEVFLFNEYNFLSLGEDNNLEGHYTILVNAKTFDYRVFQMGTYSSNFTSMNEPTDPTVYNAETLLSGSKKILECIIADKLLSAYFYDGKQINNQGKNLIPTKYCKSGDDVSFYEYKNKGSAIFDDKFGFTSDLERRLAQELLCQKASH